MQKLRLSPQETLQKVQAIIPQTNVQEEGVDELDVVKTDGEYIYVAQDKGLHIADSLAGGRSPYKSL